MKEQTFDVEMAYVRVSTKSQNTERQKDSIYEAIPDLKAKYYYEDKFTGKDFENREQYNAMKNKITELKEIRSDISIRVTIHELDRIGRNYIEIQNEVSWFRGKGVVLNFLDIPSELVNSSMGITSNLLIDLVILLKAYWAETELKYKEKRASEGIAKAKERGVKFGRTEIKISEKEFRQQADRAINRFITHKEAMNNLGLKSNTYWKKIKQWYPNYRTNKSKVKHSEKGLS